MKLDVNVLRYLSKDDFRVLTAIEMGQRNHEIVPTTLIDSIAGLRRGGTFVCLQNLLRNKLVHHENRSYDGYRLTYMGYDFLAIKALVNRGLITSVGRQIGVGKESDIFEVANEEGEVLVLKIHRLGRTSFRAVKRHRDYLKGRNAHSWLYLSRLAALKEFAFMRALEEHGFPVPRAIDNNRHAILMSKVDGSTMVQLKKFRNPTFVYQQCMELLERIAGVGLIHCDLNEFNLLVNEDTEEVTLIDFPQMVSVSHPNAESLFNRDVDGVIRFFKKKIGYMPEEDEALGGNIRPVFEEVAGKEGSLDAQLAASGFKKEHQKTLEQFVEEDEGEDEDEDEGSDSEEDGEEEEDSEAESEEEEEEEERAKRSEGAAPSRRKGEEAQEGVMQSLRSLAVADGEAEEAGPSPRGDVGEEGSGGEGEESEDDEEAAARREVVHQRVLEEARKRIRKEVMSKATRNANKKGSGRAKAADAAFHGGY